MTNEKFKSVLTEVKDSINTDPEYAKSVLSFLVEADGSTEQRAKVKKDFKNLLNAMDESVSDTNTLGKNTKFLRLFAEEDYKYFMKLSNMLEKELKKLEEIYDKMDF